MGNVTEPIVQNVVEQEQLNPWLSIWLKPRATIQQIINTNPQYCVLLLAGLSGIDRALERADANNAGDILSLPILLGIAILGGALSGIVLLYIYGAVIKWTGNWFGGEASQKEIRAATAWSTVPLLLALPLWGAKLYTFNAFIFSEALDYITPFQTKYTTFLIIESILAIWVVVLFLKCLSQVQGFSIWKALGNTLAPVLVIVVPVLLISQLITAI